MRCRSYLSAVLAVSLTACGNDRDSVTVEPTESPLPVTQEANAIVEMELIQEPGFGLVLQHCVTCHSPRQFLQQRGDRATWLGLIRWMQSDHGMQPLPDGVEDRIVDYLSKHYGPRHSGRRKPLRPDLMPPQSQPK